jgi:hypothetical protein
MTRRHITRPLGAAAYGLLGAAFLPAAVAFADSYDIVPDPSSTEEVTGLYGLVTTLPAVPSVQGYQLFDVVDTSTNTTVGTFEAYESTTPNLTGTTNEELLVTQDVSGPVGTSAQDVPPVGSVIDISTYPNTGFGNIYSYFASPSGDVISETSVTPFGNFTVPETSVTPVGNLTVPGTFDAATGLANNSLGNASVPLADGYDIVPVHKFAEDVTAISGSPPVDVAVQGGQQFNINSPADATVGTFDAFETNTKDAIGTYTEELLVTQDVSGTPGTAAGDVPPVGSVFNIISYFGYPYTHNIYSDIPSSSGNVISDTFVSPYGDSTVPITFDATKVFTTDSFVVPDQYDIAPIGNEQFTGTNGVPPLDVSVQGYQQFNVDNLTNGQAGTVDADVTTHADAFGNYSEALLVTQDVLGTPGTAAGDVPPVGSIFEFVTYGISGFEQIYYDIPSPSGDVISDILVTPFGDFTIPSFGLAAGLANDLFLIPWG